MTPVLLVILVGIGLLVFSVPLFVVIGALTSLSYVLFSDLATKYALVVDNAVIFSHLDNALLGIPLMVGQIATAPPLMESARELTDKPPLLAIPFFVLSGAIMSHGAIATRLVNVARATFASLPGGLGVATVAACMFFAAISGSSPVTVITIGGVMYPALVAAGYNERFSTGLVTSAGTLGILIPPSIPMIIYAIFASGSQVIKVEDFFLAGLGPGLLIGAMLSTYCIVSGLRKGEHFGRPDFGQIRVAVVDGFWSLMLPVVILGGIYSGIFTATEAAAVSVVYSLIIEIFIHRELTLPRIPAVVGEAALLMGSLLVIFAMAVGLNHLLSDLEIPNRAAAWIMGFDLTPFTFMLVLNCFLLVVGCLMDIMSAIMILVPLLAPMAVLCGIHPIHLGIVFIVNLELGYLTPPMGLNLFVSSSIFNKPLGEVIKSVIPFTGIMLVSVLIVTYVPTISLGPVNVLNGKDFFVSFPDQAACSPSVTNDDDDDDDDDISIGNETEKGLPAAKSIGELMKSKAFKDALDDDDDKSVGTKTPTGAQSIGDLMKSKAYQNALDDDDDDDEDDDDDDDDDKTFDGKGPKSIGDLMKSKAYQKALRRDTPKTPPSAP